MKVWIVKTSHYIESEDGGQIGSVSLKVFANKSDAEVDYKSQDQADPWNVADDPEEYDVL